MTDGGGAGAVGGKSLSSLDIIHQETSSSSLLNNKRNDDDEEDEGRSPLWLIFFCAMSCGSSFRLLTLCNAESASREFSTRLDSTCGDWHSFNNFLSLLYPVIVYITSGVLFGRCLAALVTTVIQKVVFVSPITLMHAHEPLCDSTLRERERKKEFLLVLLGELCTTCTFIYIGAYTVQGSAVQCSTLSLKRKKKEKRRRRWFKFVLLLLLEKKKKKGNFYVYVWGRATLTYVLISLHQTMVSFNHLFTDGGLYAIKCQKLIVKRKITRCCCCCCKTGTKNNKTKIPISWILCVDEEDGRAGGFFLFTYRANNLTQQFSSSISRLFFPPFFSN